MAVYELVSSFHASKQSLIAKGSFKKPDMHYRTKNDHCQRFLIPVNGGRASVQFGEGCFTFWPSKNIGIVRPKSNKDFKRLKELHGDSGCWMTVTVKFESGKWFMCFPYIKKKISHVETRPVVALDPGIRTFQSGYDSTGRFINYGSGDIQRIFAYGKKIDRLQSKLDLTYYKDR